MRPMKIRGTDERGEGEGEGGKHRERALPLRGVFTVCKDGVLLFARCWRFSPGDYRFWAIGVR